MWRRKPSGKASYGIKRERNANQDVKGIQLHTKKQILLNFKIIIQ